MQEIEFKILQKRPTFQFYKNGNKVTEMKGANPKQLEAYVQQQSGQQAASGSATAKKNYGIPGHVKEIYNL